MQLYLQPYLQGYPVLQNLRGMYDLLTGVYQWLFRGKWQNVNQWSEFTHLSHELLQQFTNVTGPYAYYGWFQEFKFIYGEKISRLETYFLPPPPLKIGPKKWQKEQIRKEQGRIHGQYQLRTGGQGRKCAFSHFSTRSPLTNAPTDERTDGTTDRWTDG